MRRPCLGLEVKTTVQNDVRYCCIDVKVYFENLHVRVRVRPYPPFPTTRYSTSLLEGLGWYQSDHQHPFLQ